MDRLGAERTVRPIPATSTLAVVGAGPIGLEAAAWAVSHHWDVAVFEKVRVGHHICQWGHVKLFSPFRMNHSNWGPQLLKCAFPDLTLPSESACTTGSEYVQRYLEPLSRVPGLSERIFLGAEVVQIGKEKLAKKDWIGDAKRTQHPFRILLHNGNTEFIHKTRAVIDASGVYSFPQSLGSGNIPAPGELQAKSEASSHLHYGLVDLLGQHRRQFEGRKTLLVGGGYSAATALEAFEQLVQSARETKVSWVNLSTGEEPYYRFDNDPLPYRDDLGKLGNRLAAAPPPWLDYFAGSSIEEISRRPNGDQGTFEVVINSQQGCEKLEVDEIIANVGFMPDNSIYRQLQVHECYATSGPMKLAATLLGGSPDCLAQKSQGIETLRNPEPDFFILGNKSYGTNSTFLLTHGIKQVEAVMNHLKGQCI
ncbi:hypothetical protein MYX84_12970 [Acidobacteria bacterium AH-259-O06]|nr:hypothetical protein [Acidobacteria bacterium AH-259-O06]